MGCVFFDLAYDKPKWSLFCWCEILILSLLNIVLLNFIQTENLHLYASAVCFATPY